MTNMDKIISLIKSRGLTDESDIRKYLGGRIRDDDLVDKVIGRLVDMNIVSADDKSESRSAEGSFPAYKRAIAQFFETHSPLARSDMRMEMSFKMGWFTPSDAEIFISFCERDGLIVEKDGIMEPTFDASSVEIPPGWTMHNELGIKTGKEISDEIMRKQVEKKEISYVLKSKKEETDRLMAEDGINIDDSEEFSSDIDVSGSYHDELKIGVVRNLVSVGVPSQNANGMFDFFELNHGLVDVDTFIADMASFEGFDDDKILRTTYSILDVVLW